LHIPPPCGSDTPTEDGTVALSDDLFQQFNEIRKQRWSLLQQALSEAPNTDLDEMLADIANMATLLYIDRKSKLVPKGFQSFTKKDS
jgi:hypothetical protein